MLPLNYLFSKPSIRKWQPHVMHETYYSSLRSAPRSCPIVVTVLDMIHELFGEHFPARDKTAKLKRIAIERADRVICISENTRRDLLDLFGTPEEKIAVVHLGFDHFDSGVPLKTTKPTAAVSTKPYLLFVGSRARYKNFAGFLRAVASSKALKKDFDLLAFGGGKFTIAEMWLISRLGFLPNQVRQHGGDDAVLGHLYDHAAAFVYPTLYEGFGLPPLEAMAHHCAVVSSNTSSMPEIIGDAGELFDPHSIEDMAAAIERVVYSPARTEALIDLGKRRLHAFSWERCADRTLDIYRSLIG